LISILILTAQQRRSLRNQNNKGTSLENGIFVDGSEGGDNSEVDSQSGDEEDSNVGGTEDKVGNQVRYVII
jgi:hypothetical protein